eukprot:397760-Pyramimonas_sp.AAC.1
MPRRPEPRFGVLEVFVQGLTCHYLTTDGVLEGFRSYCMPEALESNSCSVLLKATESSTPTFSRDKLRSLAAVHRYSLVAEARGHHHIGNWPSLSHLLPRGFAGGLCLSPPRPPFPRYFLLPILALPRSPRVAA